MSSYCCIMRKLEKKNQWIFAMLKEEKEKDNLNVNNYEETELLALTG